MHVDDSRHASLRSKLIRLGTTNPELRQYIRPMLKATAAVPKVIKIEKLPDPPPSRGWSTGASSDTYTYFRVIGENLTQQDDDVVIAWLRRHNPGLVPHRDDEGYTRTVVSLSWNRNEFLIRNHFHVYD